MVLGEMVVLPGTRHRFNVPLPRHARGPMTSGASPLSPLLHGIAPLHLKVVTIRVSITGTGEVSAVRMTGAWVGQVAVDLFHVAACLEVLTWTVAFLSAAHLGVPAFLEGSRSGVAARMARGHFEAASTSHLIVSRDLRGVLTEGLTQEEREGFTGIALSLGEEGAGGGRSLGGANRGSTEAVWGLGIQVWAAQ